MDIPFIGPVTWTHVGLVGQLVVLEGLLSFDNALALAALVRTRLKNPADQRKALTWGIWGAYVFRVVIVFVGVWLMAFEWSKAVAGLYLVWMAVLELFLKKSENSEAENKSEAKNDAYLNTSHSAGSFLDKDTLQSGKSHENVVVIAKEVSLKLRKARFGNLSPLWATIVAVELMDIMFSIDSIGVALALSKIKWVLITGAVLGILMMRIAAQMFVRLIEKFPILEKTAFVLVGLAGINVLLKLNNLPLGFAHLTLNKPIPEHLFLGILVGILVGSMFYDFVRQRRRHSL